MTNIECKRKEKLYFVSIGQGNYGIFHESITEVIVDDIQDDIVYCHNNTDNRIPNKVYRGEVNQAQSQTFGYYYGFFTNKMWGLQSCYNIAIVDLNAKMGEIEAAIDEASDRIWELAERK